MTVAGLVFISAVATVQVYLLAANPSPFLFACLAVTLLAFMTVLTTWATRRR